jgi:hypothetical protein
MNLAPMTRKAPEPTGRITRQPHVEAAAARIRRRARGTVTRDTGRWIVEEPSARAASVALKLFPTWPQSIPELGELRDSLLSDMRPFDYATP